MPWQSPVTNDKWRYGPQPATVLKAIDKKFVMREPFGGTRIHVCGAGIHFTFTSLTSSFGLRRAVAADKIDRTARA
jgi:hypothetical protein